MDWFDLHHRHGPGGGSNKAHRVVSKLAGGPQKGAHMRQWAVPLYMGKGAGL